MGVACAIVVMLAVYRLLEGQLHIDRSWDLLRTGTGIVSDILHRPGRMLLGLNDDSEGDRAIDGSEEGDPFDGDDSLRLLAICLLLPLLSPPLDLHFALALYLPSEAAVSTCADAVET
jgi:hypothetical protein